MITIDSDRCIGCEVCESVCPAGVFSVANGKATANNDKCIGCKNCATICPMGCIIALEATVL